MTTIAWDGKTLAVDGAVWSNDLLYRLKKVFRITTPLGEQFLFAATGDTFYCQAVANWLKNGGETPNHKEFGDEKPDSVMGLLIGVDRVITLLSVGLKTATFPDERIFALGASSSIALGAMEAGATAKEAIEICLRRHDGAKLCVDTVSFD